MELKLETYVHPSLEIEVPIEIRKQVYEKAIELVMKNDCFELPTGNPLCLLLPCILWRPSSFGENAAGDIDWSPKDISKSFIELDRKKIVEIYHNNTPEKRKQILQEMLNELNKNKDARED